MNGIRKPATGALLAGFLLSPWANVSAAGQDQAPRRPPEPFRVFIYASDPAEPALKAALEEAIPIVRERVERRRHWFQLAGSREIAEAADISLRITNYRTGHPIGSFSAGRPLESSGWCGAREFHYVDAVVLAGEARADLSGLDYRCDHAGPGLRNAANHLAEELERFAKENYATLMRQRAETGPDEP